MTLGTISAFIQPDGTINTVLWKYLNQNSMVDVLRQVDTKVSKGRAS